MSWSLNKTGTRGAVKASVLAESQLPDSLKQAIVEVCDDVSPTTPNGIRVTGYGHQGGGFSSIGKLEVESITILQESNQESK